MYNSHLACIRAFRVAFCGAITVVSTTTLGSTTYTFTNVIDNVSSSYSQFGVTPAINDKGQVVFTATGPTFNDKGVYVRNFTGGALTTIDSTSGFGGFFAPPVINNNGVVAYTLQNGPGTEIRTGNGGSTTLIASGGNFPAQQVNGFTFNGVNFPSINDDGVVAFGATIYNPNPGPGPSNSGGIFTGTGGTLTQRYGSSASPFASINSSQQLAITGSFQHPPEDPAALESAILRIEPNGTATKFIRTYPYNGTDPAFTLLDPRPCLNDKGNIVFMGNGNSGNQIYAYNGSKLILIAAQSGFQEGQYSNFASSPSINNNGVTVFLGQTQGMNGIFTGPDAVQDKVIQELDNLFGDQVSTVNFQAGVNAHGQIAFSYSLFNGQSGIAVATPNTSAEIDSTGPKIGTSVGGGSAAVGGLEATFANVTATGRFSADYFNPADADELSVRIGSSAASSASFQSASDHFQVWTLDYSGDYSGNVGLMFRYDDQDLTIDESQLIIRHYENGQWIVPAQTLDISANTITLDTESFSPFILSGAPVVPEPATLSLTIGMLGLLARRKTRI